MLLALFAAPLHAQPQGTPNTVSPTVSPHEADLACLAGMAVLAANDEDEVREAGIYGTIFYMGKLLGRDPAFDLDARLGAFDHALVTAELQGACLREVQAVADRMRAFGGNDAR